MSRLISIGTAVPQHQTKQEVILDFMHAAYYDEVASRKLNILFNNSGIDQRYSVLPDFDKRRKQHLFFNGVPSTADVEDKMDVFKLLAVPLAMEAVSDAFQKIGRTTGDFKITHLITVSCTGLYSPGLDAILMEELNLPSDIFHTAVNFIGCNAAFHALKIADLIIKSDVHAQVLIVCVELCTIHFQPKKDHDHLLSNTIFGDGAAAVLMTSDESANKNNFKGFKMEGSYSLVLHEGKKLMGWNISAVNFEMILNSGIPDFIGKEIQTIVNKIFKHYRINRESVTKWAIHPGGKRILDIIRNELQLSASELQHSYTVLKEFGNMSSPTILFVLGQLFSPGSENNETIFSMGFGPGLSIETAMFVNAG